MDQINGLCGDDVAAASASRRLSFLRKCKFILSEFLFVIFGGPFA